MDFCKKEKKTAEVVLYLVINFGSTVILTILKFPFCKHGVYLRLFLSSLVSFNSFFFFIFSFAFLLLYLFLFFDAVISEILFLTSFSNHPLLLCRNTGDFCV